MIAAPQIPLDLGHRESLGRDDFFVAPCNENAVAWIDSWPDWPGPALCIHGPEGCGKSHLAHVWQTRSGAVTVDRRTLADSGPAVLLGEAMAAVFDDADTATDEVALLHLYNLLADRQGHLLLTAKAPPARWGIGLADLRSRLAAASAVQVGAPDEGLLGAVMIKLFTDRQIHIDHDVVLYLLTRMERSFEAVRAAVEALDRAALAAHRKVTVPLARDVLRLFDKD
jgi:chromosomal replication initiation ATPase DnaA